MLRITLPFAVFGLVLEDDRVVRAAPIAKYTIGWTEERATAYFLGRNATVEKIE